MIYHELPKVLRQSKYNIKRDDINGLVNVNHITYFIGKINKRQRNTLFKLLTNIRMLTYIINIIKI